MQDEYNSKRKSPILRKHSSSPQMWSSVLHQDSHNTLFYNTSSVIYRFNRQDTEIYFQIQARRIFYDSLMDTV